MAQPAKRTPAPKRSRSSTLKSVPQEPKVIATISPEHLDAVRKAHMLVSTKDLELKAANHFLERVNEDIQQEYEIKADRFTIDLLTGEITED